jgi:hypothetical protein
MDQFNVVFIDITMSKDMILMMPIILILKLMKGRNRLSKYLSLFE